MDNHAVSKFLDATNFDFANSDIIKPPFEQVKNNEISNKYTRVVIDSRDRDLSSYPDPNTYVIFLEQDIEEVTTGEIILMNVPLSDYNVNDYNRTLSFVGGTIVQIPLGNYTAPVLATALNNVISLALGAGVLYDSLTCTLIFDNAVGTLDFTGAGATPIARLLGFVPGKTYVTPCTAPYPVDLNTNHYIVLTIDQFTINTSSNSVLDRSTALVHPKDAHLNYRSVHNIIKKFFNPPIGRLNKLTVSFTDYYGNPYNFRNQDHRIEIVFESRKQLRKYSHFV